MFETISTSRPNKVLVIAAHPDDLEYCVAGTISKWALEGTESYFLICTSGEAGSHNKNIQPEQLASIRQDEQRKAGNILGVKEIKFLNYPDGTMQPSLELRRELTGMIRHYQPTAIMTWDPTQIIFNDSGLNHPDHLAVGNAALSAIMPSCDSPFIFPELLAEGLEPFKVHEIYLFGSEENNIWIDIGQTIELKIAALKCHNSQYENWEDLSEDIRESARNQGSNQNLPFAEAFRYLNIK